MAINQNSLVKSISEKEGKKVEVNIAQIKEVVKCTFEELAYYTDDEIIKLINSFRKKLDIGEWTKVRGYN